MEDREIFDMSGFTVPKALETAREKAQAGLVNIKTKIEENKAKADAAATEADRLRKEVAQVIVSGKDDSDFQAQIRKQNQAMSEAVKIAGQLEALLPEAEKAIQTAQEAIFEHIKERLDQCRGKRTSQLERAQVQRAKSMGESRDGRLMSEPPDQPGTACLCWCEYCGSAIARIADPENVRQPLTAADFIPATQRWPYPPFRPGADFEYFTCPTCNRRPWMEEDRILVTDGFRMIPGPVDAEVDDNRRKAS